MSVELENDLREALAQHAAGLPADPSARLRGLDYRPRSPYMSGALAAGGIGGAAGAAAIALSVVGLGAGTQSAFAGWTPSPTVPAAGQTAAAEAACEAKITAADWHPVVTDTRGPFTIVVFEAKGGKGSGSCLERSPDQPISMTAEDFGERPPAPVAPEQARVEGSGSEVAALASVPLSSAPRYQQVIGRVGAEVSGVTLALSGGTHVTATVQNGWFLAWWPGDETAVSEEVTSAAGTTTSHL